MIKEPPHFGNDKPWMNQLKNWCRTVKDEFERTALRGDGVTTSISSGVVHANPSYSSGVSSFEWIRFVDEDDEITIGEGYVKVLNHGYISSGETSVSISGVLGDGEHYLAIEIIPTGSISFFITNTILSDDIDNNKFYYYLYKFTSETGTDDSKTLKITLDMRSTFTLTGF